MYRFLSQTLDINIVILLIILCCLLIGIIIFLLSGISIVKENEIVITEKAGKKCRALKKGIHYLIPLVEIKVGKYNLDVQIVKAFFKNFSIVLQYKIVDPSVYHYSGHDYTLKLSESLSDIESIDNIKDIISNISDKYGVEPLKVEITQL